MSDKSNDLSDRIDLSEKSITLEQKGNTFRDIIKFILEEYKLGVYITSIALLGLAVTTFSDITLPTIVVTSMKALAIGIIPAMIIGKLLIVDRFMSTRMKRVLALNPQEGYTPDILFVPPPIWRERKSDTKPIKKCDVGFLDFIVEKFHFDKEDNQLYVTGINPEIADPVDIAVRDGRLEQVFDDLLKSRMKLKKLEGTLKTKHLDIQTENINSLISAVEKGTTMDMDESMSFDLDDDLDEFAQRDNENDNEEQSKEEERKTLSEIEQMMNGDNNE